MIFASAKPSGNVRREALSSGEWRDDPLDSAVAARGGLVISGLTREELSRADRNNRFGRAAVPGRAETPRRVILISPQLITTPALDASLAS